MTFKPTKALLIILVLISLLIGFYWFVVRQTTNTNEINKPHEKVSIFNLRGELKEGWSQKVVENSKQDTQESEILQFKKDTLIITLRINLTKQIQSKVYTGFKPETREFLITDTQPIKIGAKDKIHLGRVRTDQGLTLVDLDSMIVRQGQKTYVYELPILVSRSGYETKTIIKYEGDGINNTNLLDEADKLVLSLTTNPS